jgi:hypothetical protein
MTSPSTEARYRELVAVSAIGGLDPEDAGSLRVHLTGCAACRRELAEARQVAALLERVPAEAFVNELASPDDPVLARALRRIGAEASIRASSGANARPEFPGWENVREDDGAEAEGRKLSGHTGQHARRPERTRAGQSGRHGASDRPSDRSGGRPPRAGRRWRSGLAFVPPRSRTRVAVGALALALGLLGTGGIIGWSAGSASDRGTPVNAAATSAAEKDASSRATTPRMRTLTARDAKTNVSIQVEITPESGWVRLDATITGAPAGVRCRLDVKSGVGEDAPAGSWVEPAQPVVGGTTLTGSAWLDISNIGAVTVVTEDGQTLVTAAM